MNHIDLLAQDEAYRPANLRGLSWCLPPVRLQMLPSLPQRLRARAIWPVAVALALCSAAIDYAAQADLQGLEADEQLLARALLEGDPRRRLQLLLNRRWRCFQRHHVSRDPLAAVEWRPSHAS